MYRIEQLRPLSRQHQLGLSLSRQAMQCPKDSTTDDILGIGKHWWHMFMMTESHILRLKRGIWLPLYWQIMATTPK